MLVETTDLSWKESPDRSGRVRRIYLENNGGTTGPVATVIVALLTARGCCILTKDRSGIGVNDIPGLRDALRRVTEETRDDVIETLVRTFPRDVHFDDRPAENTAPPEPVRNG